MKYPTRDNIVITWCFNHSCWFIEGCWECGIDEKQAEIQQLREEIAKLEKGEE